MSDKEIIAHVVLKKDEVLTTKKISNAQPNFYKVGNGTVNKHGIKSIDLLDVLMDCSRPAQSVFRKLKQQLVWDPYEGEIRYIAVMRRKDMIKSEEKQFDRGVKELIDLDIVRRLKPSHYMINPNALIPPNYEKWCKVWDKAGGKELDSRDPDHYLLDA